MIDPTNYELVERLKEKINQAKGWICFADFMQTALYEPGLGYYASNHIPVGKHGDFITAAETSSLFAKSISKFMQESLPSNANILELGAGSGKFLANVLTELKQYDLQPKAKILELSPGLVSLQKKTLANHNLTDQCEWITKLPEEFNGIIIMNEVLDALACMVISKKQNQWLERGVTWHNDDFIWVDGPAVSTELQDELVGYEDYIDGYTLEINLQAEALIRTLATTLKQGLILIIDYGFSQKELHHPQRIDGTLISHYQQKIEHNVLLRPGLQDITSHVNFTKIANTAKEAELDLTGYTEQASFLIDLGIVEEVENKELDDIQRYQFSQELQSLLMPQEMGELFKVLALSKNLDGLVTGFSKDKSNTL